MLGAGEHRSGIVLVGAGLSGLAVARRARWHAGHGRQRVFNVVVVIVEAILEALVMAGKKIIRVFPEGFGSAGSDPNPPSLGVGIVLASSLVIDTGVHRGMPGD